MGVQPDEHKEPQFRKQLKQEVCINNLKTFFIFLFGGFLFLFNYSK
jgi:hypothetical protein